MKSWKDYTQQAKSPTPSTPKPTGPPSLEEAHEQSAKQTLLALKRGAQTKKAYN